MSKSIAKRVIFIAAGFGSRMMPATSNRPKPLVTVNNIRFIDTLIDAFLNAGINEIYIVRGYLKDKFNELLDKYPMIKFIDNDEYKNSNNILSVILAKDLLSNAYVSEADLFLTNKDIICKEHDGSDFLGIKVTETDDWCFDADENGYLSNLRKGGSNCYQEIGISYWDEEAGKKLAVDLVKAYEMKDGHNQFWESVPLLTFAENYKVKIKPCSNTDIVEIDNYYELQQLDGSYK